MDDVFRMKIEKTKRYMIKLSITLYQVSCTHACLTTHHLGSVTTRVALDIVENVPVQKIWHNDEWFIIQNISTKEFWRGSVKLFD